MVAVPSTMVPLGTPAPPFDLADPRGHRVRSDDLVGQPLLVMFICNHCPYVKHLGRELGLVTQQFAARGVAVVGINSNDTDARPDDGPGPMLTTARGYGWDFPYLLDPDQEVATAYRAACTPDFFLFDAGHHLAYRGQFDDSRPSLDVPVTGSDLRAAVNAVLAGEAVPEPHHPSMGCNIKWRPGNEPPWFG